MIKAIVTGANGFVGKYLLSELKENAYSVIGVDILPNDDIITIDLLDYKKVEELIIKEKPDVVFNLAGQADVGISWLIPQKTFELNVLIPINILEAIKNNNLKTKALFVGSSDIYGNLCSHGEDVKEDTITSPNNPYSLSKKIQEEVVNFYYKTYSIETFLTRSFNHGGAGQKQGFFIPDMISKIVDIENGNATKLCVGDLSTSRDFCHVKDVVRAYRLIVEKGEPGEIYNVGSGMPYCMKDILELMLSKTNKKIDIVIDDSKMRKSDTKVVRCNHDKLTKATGWKPIFSIDDIISDVYNEWRNK